MFHLLVCIDRSEFARAVLPAARKLAAAAGAEVELVTVIPVEHVPGEPWSGQHTERSNGHSSPAVERERESLADVAAQFEPAARVTVLRDASAAQAILRYARLVRPDVIALATHSRGAMGEAALGSTAREISRAAVAPVLLVHPLGVGGMRPGDIPLGIFAFTSDGERVGQVAEVTAERMRIKRHDGGEVWLPVGAAEAVTTGQLVLQVAAADLAEAAAAEAAL